MPSDNSSILLSHSSPPKKTNEEPIFAIHIEWMNTNSCADPFQSLKAFHGNAVGTALVSMMSTDWG